MTQKIQDILAAYESDNPGTKANIARMLMAGQLGGTGRMVILPVDQGFEHGAARSFAMNPAAFDPHYHYKLAIDAGLNAYAAPLGSLEAGADTFAGQIPTILKINSSNSLIKETRAPDQAITASVDDALRLGCSAIGLTIYPGSDAMFNQMEELKEIAHEAKAKGLAVVVWAYPRGGALSAQGEQAIDVVAYGAHMAALMGAHIIKVKIPTDFIEQDAARKIYESEKIKIDTKESRIAHIVQSCFNGRRIVVFSGGAAKGTDQVLDDARAIHAGGGFGSIIGRNCFQRPRAEALELLQTIINLYKESV